ncbi:MAG: BatD family protein, partial [Halieaceae bacterium]
MTAIGKHTLRWLTLAVTLLTSGYSFADVTASLDRNQVAMGDTLQLNISADGGENINAIDLRPLLKDFEILRRSTSSSTRIVNGQTTRTREITLAITARREGTLRIPALQVDNSRSNMLLVNVGP